MRLIVSVELKVDEAKFRERFPGVEEIRREAAAHFVNSVDDARLDEAGIEVEGAAAR